MIVKVIRRKNTEVLNIRGKKLSKSYVYYIMIWRWFRRRKYLRLIGNWDIQILNDQPCKIELTSSKRAASTFRDTVAGRYSYSKAMADTIVTFIKTKPDLFILS